jgi:hypothetical protein
VAQCVAHSKRTGEPCRQRAIAGATVCRVHGGATPQVRRAAARRLLAAEAAATLGTDVPPIGDAGLEFGALLGRAKALEQALWRSLDEGLVNTARLDMYRESLRDLGRFLVEAQRLGLLERQVRVGEAATRVISDALIRILDELRERMRERFALAVALSLPAAAWADDLVLDVSADMVEAIFTEDMPAIADEVLGALPAVVLEVGDVKR